MTDDARRQKRRKVDIDIFVIDFMTKLLLGSVVDISESGMKVTTTTTITPDALFQFDLQFPKQYVTKNSIRVGAQELWTVYNNQLNTSEVGFRFIDISAIDRAWIRNWVNEAGSSYV